jgi:hypothetical protein
LQFLFEESGRALPFGMSLTLSTVTMNAWVRRLLADFANKFLLWSHFLVPYSEMLVLVLLSLCRYSKHPGGMLVPEAADQEIFLVENYGGTVCTGLRTRFVRWFSGIT